MLIFKMSAVPLEMPFYLGFAVFFSIPPKNWPGIPVTSIECLELLAYSFLFLNLLIF